VLDLDSLHVSITECGACHQPIALPADTACASCGAPVLPSGPPVPAEISSSGQPLLVDLRNPPPGIHALGTRPRAADIPPLRRLWEETTKAALAGPHTPEDEFRGAWLAAMLARFHAGTGDAVRERAVLEAALARVSLPAYRALLLARLARSAALAGRFELAERWLAACPPPTGIAEVDTDVDVARALLLLRRGGHGEALSILGPSDEGSALAGQARILGDLLRIDAIEKMGDRWHAYALYRKAIRVHGAVPLQDLVLYYGVANKSRRLIVATGLAALVALIPLVVYILWTIGQR